MLKMPKKQKREEEYTVFILSCDGKYALQKRPDAGLLAGLWQFPNVPGKLETADALAALETLGMKPKDIMRQSDRKHIFTHIRWEMRAYWVALTEPAGDYRWLTADEIDGEAALPTAFRQFWEETKGH